MEAPLQCYFHYRKKKESMNIGNGYRWNSFPSKNENDAILFFLIQVEIAHK